MKRSLKIISAAFLAAAVCGALVQRSALSNVHQENQKLRGESEDIPRLVRQNAEIDRLRAENQEIEKLRLETRDLHKLRNEVHQLRQRKPEFDKVRAENERLRSTAKSVASPSSSAAGAASLITREALSDAGLGSPEATLQTLFWSMREGNLEKMRSCFAAETPDDQLPSGSAPALKGFKGFRVVGKKVISAGNMKLGIQQFSAEGESGPEEWVLSFKQVGNEWKIDLGR